MPSAVASAAKTNEIPARGPAAGSVRRNAASLFVLQWASYLLPLLVIPYLVRVLGTDGYGRLGFAQAFIQYFVILADYGFNLTATQQIAIAAADERKISEIFWTTLAAKAVLAGVGVLALLVLIALVPQLRADVALLLVAYGTVVGSVLFPTWLFQGVERMSFIAVATLAARFTIVPLTFVLVRSPHQVLTAVAIQAGSALLAAAIALWSVRMHRLVCWCRPTRAGIASALRDGWHVFASMAAISLYNTSNPVIIRFAAGETAVGYFVAVNQIRLAVQSLANPLGQALYPRITALLHSEREQAYVIIRRLLRYVAAGTAVLSIALFVTAPLVVEVALGPKYVGAITTLRWLAPIPLIGAIGNVLGIHTMVPLGMKRTYSRVLLAGGIVNVPVVALLAHRLHASGAAAGVLFTELLVTGVLALSLVRARVPVFFASDVSDPSGR